MARRSKQFKGNKGILPNKDTMELLDGKLRVDLYYNNLSNKLLESTKQDIEGDLKRLKELLDIKENDASSRKLEIYIYDNMDSYRKLTGSMLDYGHFEPELNRMHAIQNVEGWGVTSPMVTLIAQYKKLLPNKEIMDLPKNNLQVDIYYNKLNHEQLEGVKREVTKAYSDFEKLYGIRESDTKNIFRIFIEDSEIDFFGGCRGIVNGGVSIIDRHISYSAYMLYNPDIEGFNSLHKQVSSALSFYSCEGCNYYDWSKVLPNEYMTIEIPKSNVELKLISNGLTNKQIKTIKKDVVDAFKGIKFDAPAKLQLDSYSYLNDSYDNISNNLLILILKRARPYENHNLESARKALEDPIVQRDASIIISSNTKEEQNQRLLLKQEVIEFPRYGFEVKLHYNDLKDGKLERAKQEIKNTVYDFKEAFGLIDIYPDIKGELQIFIHDNWDNFRNYARPPKGAAGFAKHIDYKASSSFLYLNERFIGILRHEFGHQLTFNTDYYGGMPQILSDGIADHMTRQSPTISVNLDKYAFTDENLQKIKDSELDISQAYGTESHILMTFFEEKYLDVIDDILHNSGKYSSSLEHFKKKFPHLVDHISDYESFDDCDAYNCNNNYTWKFFNRILEKPKIKQELLDFVSAKIAENKYIEKVESLNAFRVVKGDHIGTNKNTDEEYYQGIIVDKNGEIGSFSPMEYSYTKKGIKVLNHATKDSIVLPKEYHNLKLVKVDNDYKLAFCDKRGNEYISTQNCKSKTKDLLYTDNAQEAFALVDLHAIKGIVGAERNLGKIFSIKSTNSKPISIYDGSKNVGSFTGEVGYVNRGKFYFKDSNSASFKAYDKNRALVTNTKENGESLGDGNDIDNISKFQTKSIKLDGNHIDSYCKNRETGEVSEIDYSLFFASESNGQPNKTEIIEFNSFEDDDEEEDYYDEKPGLTNDEDDDYDEKDEVSMSYEMVKGRLQIKDNKTNEEGIKLPKKFKYLKLVEDDEGERKFALCDSKGRTLSDYKGNSKYAKYAKMDDKYKYIDAKAINFDEEIDLDDYEEGDIFSIRADKENQQIIKIFDYYEEEIGELNSQNSAYYLSDEDDTDWSIEANENKIVIHPDKESEEEMDFDGYDEEGIFPIQDGSQKIVRMLDAYKDEEGMLPNSYFVESNDAYYF